MAVSDIFLFYYDPSKYKIHQKINIDFCYVDILEGVDITKIQYANTKLMLCQYHLIFNVLIIILNKYLHWCNALSQYFEKTCLFLSLLEIKTSAC